MQILKWIEQHSHISMLKQKPHYWSIAILLHPIVLGANIYKRRYHMNYVHAKKLFVLDLGLFLSTIILIAGTLFFYSYDPTITPFIDLSITPLSSEGTPVTKIASGEAITYKIHFMNTSEKIIEAPTLAIYLPSFFEPDHNPNWDDHDTHHTYTLSNIHPGEEGNIEIKGRYFGAPDIAEEVFVTLTYTQEGRTLQEMRHQSLISTLRGSLLTATLDLPELIPSNGDIPLTITLHNQSDIPLEESTLPTTLGPGTQIIPEEKPLLNEDEDRIIIPSIAPNEQYEIQAILQLNHLSGDEITLTMTPEMTRNNTRIPQQQIAYTRKLAHPAINVTSRWQDEYGVPGKTATIMITLKNTGNVALTDMSITTPLPPHITTGGQSYISAQTQALLSSLAPGEQVEVPLTVTIRSTPYGDANLALSLEPTVSATAGSHIPYSKRVQTDSLSIASTLSLSGELRYYTNEGDQLGRGPLPPTVGKQTYYRAIITIQNNSNEIRDVSWSANLPSYVVWSDRSSVSLGNDMTYHADTHSITWSAWSMSPYQTAILSFELGFTPVAADIGKTQSMLTNMSLSATDHLIGKSLSASSAPLSTNLPTDTLATNRGVIVVE